MRKKKLVRMSKVMTYDEALYGHPMEALQRGKHRNAIKVTSLSYFYGKVFADVWSFSGKFSYPPDRIGICTLLPSPPRAVIRMKIV